MKISTFFFAVIVCALAFLAQPARNVAAQALPTSMPTSTTVPTTAPTSTATTSATTKPTTAPTSTIIPAYSTTAPTTEPTILPGTPPPFSSIAAGCQVFPIGDPVYNTEIATAPVDPQSDALMASFLAADGPGGKIQISGARGSWQINYANANTPTYPVVTAAGASVAGITDFPFDPSFTWAGKGDPRPQDHHLIVLNTSTCALYEAYVSGSEPPASWNVVNGKLTTSEPYAMKWDLNAPYPAIVKSGVNAADVPHYAGMVRWEDIQSGCVCHALNMDVTAHSLRSSAFVFPARQKTPAGYYTGPIADASTALPLGAHLRLRSDYKLECPATVTDRCYQAQMVVRAWQVFGAYVMDTGGYSGVAYFAMQPQADGTQKFPFTLADIITLNSVPMSAFEVVPPPGCASVAACVKP